MGSLNQVTLIGNLTRDPETKQMRDGGDSVTSCGLAMNEKWTNKDGSKGESVCFVDFEVWGKQGETFAQYCTKGKQICLIGKLKMDEWEDRETGQKRSKLKVRANPHGGIVFLGSKADDEGGGRQGGGQQGGGYRDDDRRARSGDGVDQGRSQPQGGNRKPPQDEVNFDDIPF